MDSCKCEKNRNLQESCLYSYFARSISQILILIVFSCFFLYTKIINLYFFEKLLILYHFFEFFIYSRHFLMFFNLFRTFYVIFFAYILNPKLACLYSIKHLNYSVFSRKSVLSYLFGILPCYQIKLFFGKNGLTASCRAVLYLFDLIFNTKGV